MPATCSTRPASASVASNRETVLALMPVRRAISFVPSPRDRHRRPTGVGVSDHSGERVENGDGALDGGDMADGWLAGTGHARLRSVNFDTALPRRQFMALPARPPTSSSAPASTACRQPSTSPRSSRPRARHRRGHPRRRQAEPRGGRVGHRLRRRAQQLLPAGDERAHAGLRGGLGVRPGRLRVQPRRVHGARRRGPGRRPDRHRGAPGANRLPLADRRRASARWTST